jgi:hypothetical protein
MASTAAAGHTGHRAVQSAPGALRAGRPGDPPARSRWQRAPGRLGCPQLRDRRRPASRRSHRCPPRLEDGRSARRRRSRSRATIPRAPQPGRPGRRSPQPGRPCPGRAPSSRSSSAGSAPSRRFYTNVPRTRRRVQVPMNRGRPRGLGLIRPGLAWRNRARDECPPWWILIRYMLYTSRPASSAVL